MYVIDVIDEKENYFMCFDRNTNEVNWLIITELVN